MSGNPGVILLEREGPSRTQTLQALQAARCSCVAVGNITEALAEVKRARPHLLVLDCASFMPGDEQTLAQVHMLRQTAGAPLIILAGLDTPTEFIEGLGQAGADDYLFKPLQPRQLQLRLEMAMASAPKLTSTISTERWGPKTVSLVHGRQMFAMRIGELFEQSGYHVHYNPIEEKPGDTSGISLHILCADTVDELAHALRLHQPHGPRMGSRWFLICNGGAEHLITGVAGSLMASFDMVHACPEHLIQKANAWFSRVGAALQPESRVPFFCPVEYREAGSMFGNWNSCYSYDLSPGGIFLRTLVPARPGSAVELKLHLTTLRAEMLGTGVVAWANTYTHRKVFSYPVGMGVHFLGMSPRGLALLRELCGVDPSVRRRE